MSKLTLYFCCLFIIVAASFQARWNAPIHKSSISWDVAGYYSYLPALFIYKDLQQLQFLKDISKTIPTSGYNNTNEAPNGNKVITYSSGLALSYSPAFLIAHTIAKFTSYEANGYTYPYHVCLSWWSIFIACIGLFYIRKCLRFYFSEKTVSISLILLVIGTNYLNYTSFDHAMTHNYLFTVYALLIYYTIQLYAKPDYRKAILVGLLVGLAILIRPSELIAILIPVLWGIQNKTDLLDRLQIWGTHYTKIVAAVVATIAIGSLQLIYWKYVTDSFLFYSYNDQGFSWLKPHFQNVFFSFRKGWLIYTPLMSFALIGFIFLLKKNSALFLACFTFSLLNIYIVSAWNIWWYGGSFGQRALVQSYAILLFPFSAFISVVSKKRFWLLAPFVVFCICLNLFQTYQAQAPTNLFESEFMTKAYYKRIFFNLNQVPRDKFLLDIDTDFRSERKNTNRIFETSFEATDIADNNLITSNKAYKGKHSTFVDKENIHSLSSEIKDLSNHMHGKEWLRVGAYFYYDSKEWSSWKMPQFMIHFYQNDKITFSKYIRPNRITFEKKWEHIWMDFPIPDMEFNRINIYLWNPHHSQYRIYMDDLYMETYNE